MPKPRIFVSSTYYDLKHIRSGLESFIHSFGYEPVLFESGDVFFKHDKPLDQSCYSELHSCHMLISIMGGSYGSPESQENLTSDELKNKYKTFTSITRQEYNTAHQKRIPMYFFVDHRVLSEYNTFKANRENTTIEYPTVTNISVFHLLDEIYNLTSGNYIKEFIDLKDITNWLTIQWAHLMGHYLINDAKKIELETLSQNIDNLSSIVRSLEQYTETILSKVEPSEANSLIKEQKDLQKAFQLETFRRSSIYHMIKAMGTTLDDNELLEKFLLSKTLRHFVETVISTDTTSENVLFTNSHLIDSFVNMQNMFAH